MTTCTNPMCPEDTKLLRDVEKLGRKIILFTLEDGVCATNHHKLSCPCESLVIVNHRPFLIYALYVLKHAKQFITTTILFPGASELIIQESLLRLKSASIISSHATLSTCL